MSEDIVNMISPSEESYGSIKLRKPTAGTLSLCDFAKLKITSGVGSELPFFEAIAFFYIHSKNLKEVKQELFDTSMGRDDDGRTLAFVDAVVQWGDEVELGGVAEMGGKIGEMLSEAMSPKVEAISKSVDESEASAIISGDSSKKKATPPPPS